jgi:hypothetical protein
MDHTGHGPWWTDHHGWPWSSSELGLQPLWLPRECSMARGGRGDYGEAHRGRGLAAQSTNQAGDEQDNQQRSGDRQQRDGSKDKKSL